MTIKPINDGWPAFPINYQVNDCGDFISSAYPGMTLRAYFAGQAMAGDLAEGGVVDLENRARHWVEAADALIQALGE